MIQTLKMDNYKKVLLVGLDEKKMVTVIILKNFFNYIQPIFTISCTGTLLLFSTTPIIWHKYTDLLLYPRLSWKGISGRVLLLCTLASLRASSCETIHCPPLSYNSLLSSLYLVTYFLPYVPPSVNLFLLPHRFGRPSDDSS